MSERCPIVYQYLQCALIERHKGDHFFSVDIAEEKIFTQYDLALAYEMAAQHCETKIPETGRNSFLAADIRAMTPNHAALIAAHDSGVRYVQAMEIMKLLSELGITAAYSGPSFDGKETSIVDVLREAIAAWKERVIADATTEISNENIRLIGVIEDLTERNLKFARFSVYIVELEQKISMLERQLIPCDDSRETYESRKARKRKP